jgi:Tfp pilus assembly protein PilN
MIRINLVPSKRKRAVKGGTMVSPRVQAPSRGGGGSKSGAQLWIVGMVIGWAALGGAGWWLVTIEDDASAQLRTQAAAKNKEVDAIKQEIDETGLQERQDLVDQTRIAIKKVEAKRRTPVFVLYELAMILTDGKDGGGPDIDQEKYRQNLKSDPQSAINDRWDPSGLWLETVQDNDGILALTGAARDASDLTEFTRRLRASARFGEPTNADYQRDPQAKSEDEARYLTWTLDVSVKRWN